MPTRSRQKADQKKAARLQRKADIAAQYGIAAPEMEPSRPAKLGVAMFLRKRDMKQFVGAGGTIPYVSPLSNDDKEPKT